MYLEKLIKDEKNRSEKKTPIEKEDILKKDLNISQKRIINVLERMVILSILDKHIAEVFAVEIDRALDTMYFCDEFGKDGENDPRGNQRESVEGWSAIFEVQGVDK